MPTRSAKNSVLRAADEPRERDVRGRQAVGVSVRDRVWPLRLMGDLERRHVVDADFDAVRALLGERVADLVLDRLAPMRELTLIGGHLLRPRHLVVVLVAVLVHPDADLLDQHLRRGQHGGRLEVGQALFERVDAVEQRLPIRVG